MPPSLAPEVVGEIDMRDTSSGPLGAERDAVLRDLHSFLRDMGLYLLMVILASGGGFLFQNLMAADGWSSYAGAGDASAQGQPLLAQVAAMLRNGVPLHPFDTVLFYAALTVFAFTVFRRWTPSPWLRLLLVSLFVSSPFLVEPLLLTAKQVPLSAALLLLSLWFISVTCTNAPFRRRMSWPAVTLGGIAAAIAVAITGDLVVLMLGAAIIEVSRALLQDNLVGANRLLPMMASLVIALLAGVVLASTAVLLAGIGVLPGIDLGAAGFIRTPQELVLGLRRFADYWVLFLLAPHDLFPLAVKLLVWLVAACAVVQSILARDFGRLLAILVVGALLSALPLSPGVAARGFPYAYGAVFSLALFPCFLAAAAVTVQRRASPLHRVACIAAALVVAVGASSLSAAQARIANLNRRDLSTVTQFLSAIRASGVANWKVAMIGSYSDGAPVSWTRGASGCSAFACRQALGPLLRLTMLERNPEGRVFSLSPAEQAEFAPDLAALVPGSSQLVRMDNERFVILLK